MLKEYVFRQLEMGRHQTTVRVDEKRWTLTCFGGRWIGREGPKPHPDLTLLDLLFWGVVKNEVYSDKFRDLNCLREIVIANVATISQKYFSTSGKKVIFVNFVIFNYA